MDSVVYDMSKGKPDPQIFIKKDWVNILDNQNGAYNGNQSVIDTSQLSNSSKYINYREAYLNLPIILTATAPASAVGAEQFLPNTPATSADYVFGLKNWYGSIIHSMTLDMNGTTIVQQTPYAGLYNTFQLMTSLSVDDLATQGSAIGFFPDSSKSIGVASANNVNGIASSTVNNNVVGAFDAVGGVDNGFSSFNEGLLKRQQCWNFDVAGLSTGGSAYSTLITTQSLTNLWKSYIYKKQNATAVLPGVFQVAITAIIKLKHLHSFFNKIPLSKGLFLKLTLNLNQSSVSLTRVAGVFTAVSVNSPLGGVSPIMVANNGVPTALPNAITTVSVNVGKTVLNNTNVNQQADPSPFGSNIILNCPAYTFTSIYESSYLENPIKTVDYCDIYQYQVLNIASGAVFNQLISNGISGVKGVLVLPYYTATANAGIQPIQSPFEGSGGGPTSPLCLLTNFNVQLSGQNQIYNTQRYSHSQFMDQLAGSNGVSSAQIDGLTSSLVGLTDFEHSYNYYYVNCSYGEATEKDVPKSVNLIGTNSSAKAIDLFVFVIYDSTVSFDVLTGSRVG